MEWALGGRGVRRGELALPEVTFPPIPLEDNEGSFPSLAYPLARATGGPTSPRTRCGIIHSRPGVGPLALLRHPLQVGHSRGM